MKLHVELGRTVIKRRLSKPFALWLCLRQVFPEGRFKISRAELRLIRERLDRSHKTITRQLAYAVTEKLVRPRDRSGWYYLNSYAAVCHALGIKSKSAFEFDVKQVRQIKEVFFSVNVEHLIRWRRKHWTGAGIHDRGIQPGQSTKKGNDFLFTPAMLSTRYLAKVFAVSPGTIDTLKERCTKLGLFQVRPTRIPLHGSQAFIREIKAAAEYGAKVVWVNGGYHVNHCDRFFFRDQTRFFSRQINPKPSMLRIPYKLPFIRSDFVHCKVNINKGEKTRISGCGALKRTTINNETGEIQCLNRG